jgi:hypothetical protein
MCNLSNIDAAMRGGFMSVIEVHLMCVGGGPTLDYADATAFFAKFQPMIDMARKRRLNGLIYGLVHWRCAMWRMSGVEVVMVSNVS